MKNIHKNICLVAISLLGHSAFAQKNVSEQVNVVRSYKPILAEALRINTNPEIKTDMVQIAPLTYQTLIFGLDSLTKTSNEQAQFATQGPQVDAQEPVEVIVQPELVALKPEEEELVQQVKTATQTVANDVASGLVQPATQVAQSSPVQPEPPMLESTSGTEPSIQAQLAAQQTIALLEAYALQKQAEQEAKDLLEQQRLQSLQEQVQQQQALAETKRLQEEQRLWVQAAEETSRIFAEQKQILEAELQRQRVLLQVEAEFKAKVMAEQAALEQLAREQQALLAEQAEQARLAAIEAHREELRQSFAKAELAERARIAEAAQALNAKQQAWANQIQSERLSLEQARLAAKEAQEAAEAKRMAELKQQADEMRQALAARQQQEKQAADLQAQKLAQIAAQAEQDRLAALAQQREAQELQAKLAAQAEEERIEAERLATAQQLAQEQQDKAQAEQERLAALAQQREAQELQAKLAAQFEQGRLAAAAQQGESKELQAKLAAQFEQDRLATLAKQREAQALQAKLAAQAEEERLAAIANQQEAQALQAKLAAQAEEERLAAIAKQQEAQALQVKLAAQAEEERLAAIAQQREERRQARLNAELEEQNQIANAEKTLRGKQQAQAELIESELQAKALELAQSQRQAQALQAQLAAQAEQDKLAAIAQNRQERRQAQMDAELAELNQSANANKALSAKQQARAEKAEAERLATAEQLAQLGKEAAEAKRMAELKQQADEMRQSLAAMKEAEEAKRLADLKKQSDEMRQSLAVISKEQQVKAEAAKATAKVVVEQMADANITAGEVEFIKQNKLTELVESMDAESQGKSKSTSKAKPANADKTTNVPPAQSKPPKTQAPVILADKEGEMNWTSMPPATDLPPQVAKLGETFIDTVYKQLPSSKKMAKSMPFDEFKWRIKEAIDTSPDIAVVSNLAEQSKTGKSLAMSSLLPQVTGTSDSGKRTIKNPWLDSSYQQDGANFGITVSQLVFDFGATMFGLKAGKARVKAAEELLMSKKSEQALKSINAFIELERARDQYNLASQNAKSRLELIKLVKERFALGGGTKPDVIRAESRYAEALSTVALASSKVSAAEATYRELFASNPTGVVVGPDHEFVVEGLNKSAEELAGTYPGLLQLARLKDAASEESKAVIAKTLPSFNLVYSNTSQGHFVANVNPASSSSLVLQMSVPLYDGGAGNARKDDARLKAKQSELEFEAAMRSFEKILLQNQAEVKNSEEILTSRSVSVRSAIASMRAVREQFAFNKGTLLDLISVQDSLYQSGRDMIDANADRHLARYRLAHLTSELHKVFLLSDTPLTVKD